MQYFAGKNTDQTAEKKRRRVTDVHKRMQPKTNTFKHEGVNGTVRIRGKWPQFFRLRAYASCLTTRYDAGLLDNIRCRGIVGFIPVLEKRSFSVVVRDAERLIMPLKSEAFASYFP